MSASLPPTNTGAASLTNPDDSGACGEVFTTLRLQTLFTEIFDTQEVLSLAIQRYGHGIGEAEGDELDEAGEIAMRLITALVPAEETDGTLLVREWT